MTSEPCEALREAGFFNALTPGARTARPLWSAVAAATAFTLATSRRHAFVIPAKSGIQHPTPHLDAGSVTLFLMSASYVAYIDESGDEGFVFNPDGAGSSHWFVLAAVVTRKNCDLETVKLVDRLREKLAWQRKPLHFRHLKHEHRLPFIDLIAKAKVRVLAVAVHKPSLKEPETFQRKSVLYHYASRYLLERLSWCCRDHHQEGEGDGSAEIVFSNRTGTSYPELKNYFELLRRQSEVGDARIDWDVIRPVQVSAMNHDARMGLQIADACASAFYYGVQLNPHGFNEPRYTTMLKPVVYSHKNLWLGNGFKLWPREADELASSQPELGWIRDVYG